MRLRSFLLTAACALGVVPHDARAAQDATAYDVRTYRLDLELVPQQFELRGTVAVEVVLVEKDVETIELDLRAGWTVEKVELLDGALTFDRSLAGRRLYANHEGDRLRCELLKPGRKGQPITIAVTYSGRPAGDRITPQVFHWGRSAAGKPHVDVEAQIHGAHSWWPCKSSFRHPSDKPDRVWMHVTVPNDLTAVSSGRLVKTTAQTRDRHTFHWQLDDPIPTWGVALNVGPFVRRSTELRLPGLEEPLLYELYLLPENVHKAEIEFARIPEALRYFSEVFGPYPFPGSKLAIIDANKRCFAGATAVSFASRYPVWTAQREGRDEFFDRALVHELAHTWWGHGVTAETWSDAWLHESLATYSELLFREHVGGRDAIEDQRSKMFRRTLPSVGLKPSTPPSCAFESISVSLWNRGPLVLETLRHFVDDDDEFFGALRDVQRCNRHGTITTETLAAALEVRTGESWERFFEEWYVGHGYPRLKGKVKVDGGRILVDIDNRASGEQTFHVPLDLQWCEGRGRVTRRVQLDPGPNAIVIPCDQAPRDVRVVRLDRLLGQHKIVVDQ